MSAGPSADGSPCSTLTAARSSCICNGRLAYKTQDKVLKADFFVIAVWLSRRRIIFWYASSRLRGSALKTLLSFPLEPLISSSWTLASRNLFLVSKLSDRRNALHSRHSRSDCSCDFRFEFVFDAVTHISFEVLSNIPTIRADLKTRRFRDDFRQIGKEPTLGRDTDPCPRLVTSADNRLEEIFSHGSVALIKPIEHNPERGDIL